MNKILFVKYSNDRADQFKISTRVEVDSEDNRIVVKSAENPVALAHIESIYANYSKLERMLETINVIDDVNVYVNKCTRMGDELRFEYINANNLQQILTDLYVNKDHNRFKRILNIFISVLDQLATDDYCQSDEFELVFGKQKIESNCKSMKHTDIDLNFDNFLFSDVVTLIDYEWVFDFPIPVRYVLYRSLYYLALAISGVGGHVDEIFEDICKITKIKISKKELKTYSSMERNFHKYVQNSNCSLGNLHLGIGKRKVSIHDLGKEYDKTYEKYSFQVFYNYGEFDEGGDFHSLEKIDENRYLLELELPEHLVKLRVDPGNHACIVKIYSSNCKFESNGRLIGDNLIIFETDDPQFYFRKSEENKISLELCLEWLEEHISSSIIDGVNSITSDIKKLTDIGIQHENYISEQRDIIMNLEKKIKELTDIGIQHENYISEQRDIIMNLERKIKELTDIGIQHENYISEQNGRIKERDEWIDKTKPLVTNYDFQVFFNYGDGDDEGRFINVLPDSDGICSLTIDIPKGAKKLRLDPGGNYAIVQVLDNHLEYSTNAKKIGNYLVFETDDPQIVFENVEDLDQAELSVRLIPVNNGLIGDIITGNNLYNELCHQLKEERITQSYYKDTLSMLGMNETLNNVASMDDLRVNTDFGWVGITELTEMAEDEYHRLDFKVVFSYTDGREDIEARHISIDSDGSILINYLCPENCVNSRLIVGNHACLISIKSVNRKYTSNGVKIDKNTICFDNNEPYFEFIPTVKNREVNILLTYDAISESTGKYISEKNHNKLTWFK